MVTWLQIQRVAFGSRLHCNSFLHLSSREMLACVSFEAVEITLWNRFLVDFLSVVLS
jgi:hypothetical protein